MRTNDPHCADATIEGLCRQHNNEDAHTLFVERLASQIFKSTYKWLGLSRKDGELLSTAAILHDIGLEEDPSEHNIRSREILLEAGLAGFGPKRLKSVACVVTFHRKRVRWRDDGLFLSFKPKDRKRILKLAAILRIADGLDYTHGEAVVIEAIERKRRCVLIHVGDGNDDLAANIVRANKKADLWRDVMPVSVEVVAAADTAQRQKAGPPTIKRGHLIADAARRVMNHHFGRLKANREGTRAGEDIEALHDMRVAARRLRAAARTFRGEIGGDILEPYQIELKWIARALGEVRDLDVWVEYLEQYMGNASQEHREAIEQFVNSQKQERKARREKMISELDSDRFRQFEERFDEFLRTGILKAGADGKVGPFAAGVVKKRLKKVLKFAPGVESASEEELHRLRIACKRLRYTGEFFAQCFGKRASEMIAMLRGIQDTLGALHDATVWRGRIGETEQEALTELKKHLADKAQKHRGEFLDIWRRITAKGFQRALRKELKSAVK